MTKLLTIVVPCYNSAAYMRRSIDSLLPGGDEVEVLVVDDGSWDQTGAIADEYERLHPGMVRAIHQANGGHGEAINTGLAHATGRYIKIVDSDDWLDPEAYAAVLATLRGFARADDDIDVLVSNFVYEKVDKRKKTAVRYANAIPRDRVLSWDDVGRFRASQYILMHSLIYRTDLLRECGLVLPKHTFYVDNLYAYAPLPSVRRLYYLDVDLYRWYIGRSDQSINEDVMISRVDQQLGVNRAMMEHLRAVRSDPAAPRALKRYMLHYVNIVSLVSSMLLVRSGTKESLRKRDAFWADVRAQDPALYRRLRRTTLHQISNLPGRPGRGLSVLAYKAAQRAIGFN
ncbi:glycosyltransferase family 2 protein [Oerskovia turbata]